VTSKQNKRSARENLREERQRQAAAERRKRNITNIVIAVAVVAVIVVVFVLVQNSRTTSTVTDASLPDLVSEQGGGMVFGEGPVTVDLWEDFQCPSCKAFEEQSGELITQRVQDGDITLVIHPLSFLDENLGNTSSKLAANAFGCSAASGETAALDFHATVYANQPPEQPGTEAWSAEDLIGWGNDAGISGDEWSSCVNEGSFDDWVGQVAASQVDAGVSSTPSVFIDGERFDLAGDFASALDEAVQAAS
jgi:protein-disulfide isomerase